MTNKTKLLYPFKNSSYQTFLQDMADSLVMAGYKKIYGYNIPWKIRLLIAKLNLSRNFSSFSQHTDPLIVLGGGYIDSFAFPFAYNHKIIPILWDTWPKYWKRIISSFIRHNIDIAFFTQRITAEEISKYLPTVKCIYLPEALNPTGYMPGKNLIDREIDVLEMGRIFKNYHSVIVDGLRSHTHLFQMDSHLLFKTFKDLTNGLANAKITICFPRSITNPEQAGGIETLTQRYWECMFSRSLMLGHAPKDLIDILGYNPVIEVDWTNTKNQILNILENIGEYQHLVNKNFEQAKLKGTWESRIKIISYYLSQSTY